METRGRTHGKANRVTNDLRVVKTKRNIRDTFIKLLLIKDFNDITVQELLERALINRSTFYRYYADKYALAEEIANEFMDFIRAMMIRRAETLDIKNVLIGVDRLLEQLAVHRDVFLALMNIHTERIHIQQDLQQSFQKGYMEFFQRVYPGEECTVFQAYLFSTLVWANMRFAMEHLETYSIKKITKEMADFFRKMPMAHNV